MTTLLHLSPRHIGTHELSTSIDRTTLYSFFSTLCLVPAIILCCSFCYSELVFPIITPPTITIVSPTKSVMTSNGTKKKGDQISRQATQKNGLIGKVYDKHHDTIPLKDLSLSDGLSQGYGEKEEQGSASSSPEKTEGSSVHTLSMPLELAFSEEENEFEFIPDVEPIIDIATIQKNVVYPQKAIRSGKEGTVVLKVRIDEKGNAAQSEIVSSTSSVFDQAALNAVEHYSTNPAMNNGKAVAYTVYIPIKFRLH